LGVLPKVKALRDRMAKELPAFDLAQFDKLEDYALALMFAQTRFQIATMPPDDLQALSTDATTLRAQLLADATALSLHGLVDPHMLDQLKGANGYKNVAQDLQILSETMLESWPKIQGKSATAADELQAASRIATRLTRIIGLREQGPALLATATDQRMRAFTLVLRAYEEARDAVGYLRRHDEDADTIAPSLYLGVSKHRQTADPEPAPAPTGTQPAGTSPTPAPVSATATTEVPAISPAAATAAVAAQKGAPASKQPFLT
jgi:hypothetical protein